MKTFTVILATTLSISSAFAGTTGPITSPTFPERGKESNVTYKNILNDRAEYAQSYYSVEDLSAFDSIKTTIEDAEGNSFTFIQVKQLDDSYNIYMPASMYEKLKSQGVDLKNERVKVLSERDYLLLSKQVQLNTFGRLNSNDYLGGEGGRCAAGTIGGAIGGGITGGAVGGPVGAVAGAIGGALVGSASSCK